MKKILLVIVFLMTIFPNISFGLSMEELQAQITLFSAQVRNLQSMVASQNSTTNILTQVKTLQAMVGGQSNTITRVEVNNTLGDGQISSIIKGSPIVLKTTKQMAGTVTSIVWNGKEFINARDHGRELQAASTYYGYGECYNPTEGGSLNDDIGPTSSSMVRSYKITSNQIESETQMAFWLQPNQFSISTCGLAPLGKSYNTTILSNHIFKKKVSFGFSGIENVINFEGVFVEPSILPLPRYEITGYMPTDFSKHYTYDPRTKVLKEITSDGEVDLPIIFSTPDGKYAMGAYSLNRNVRYARQDFSRSYGYEVVKWACVVHKDETSAGPFNFSCLSPVGTLQDVKDTMDQIYTKYGWSNSDPVGNFEGVNNDFITGWFADSDLISKSINAQVFIDDVYVSQVSANLSSQDVLSAYGYIGSHRFSFNIPSKYLLWV